MATRQTSKSSNNLNASHFNVIKKSVKCLIGTKDKGLMLKPDISTGIECYTDANFARAFDKSCSENPATVFSRCKLPYDTG